MKRLGLGGMALAGLLAGAAATLAQPTLQATTTEPRAYGWQVGDVVTRQVHIGVPPGLLLDDESLPRVGRLGPAFELRQLQRHDSGGHIELTLQYQVFHAPPAVRTLELPPVLLRFNGGSRVQDLRIDAWPMTVAPLVPVEVSPRRGLGELQPDAAPPLIDTRAARRRLAACAGALALALLFLAHVYIGLPWAGRRHAPFEQAWRALRALPADGGSAPRRAAYSQLHEALNRTAGGTLFEHGLDAFVAAHARYAPLRDDLATFFQRSREEFFGGGGAAAAPLAWLTTLCRRLRDAERGSR